CQKLHPALGCQIILQVCQLSSLDTHLLKKTCIAFNTQDQKSCSYHSVSLISTWAKQRHGLFSFASPITKQVPPVQNNCIKVGAAANDLRDTIVSGSLCECRTDGMWLFTCLWRSSRRLLPGYMTNV